jgi:hypothetical protein
MLGMQIKETKEKIQELGGSSDALKLWQEKLAFLLKEEAITDEPAQRFSLAQRIKEARQMIRELSGQD